MNTRIMGLDPGLRTTGWGIIDVEGSTLTHIGHGIVMSQDKSPLSERLLSLYTQLSDIIQQYSPHEAAVEETFMNKNPASALKLGTARGVVLLAPACAGLIVGEYSANKIKKSVVGAGHADKTQVAMMVGRLLPKSGGVTKDAADALAVAICHAHHRTFQQKVRAVLYSKDFKNSGRHPRGEPDECIFHTRQRANPEGKRTRNLKGEEYDCKA